MTYNFISKKNIGNKSLTRANLPQKSWSYLSLFVMPTIVTATYVLLPCESPLLSPPIQLQNTERWGGGEGDREKEKTSRTKLAKELYRLFAGPASPSQTRHIRVPLIIAIRAKNVYLPRCSQTQLEDRGLDLPLLQKGVTL